MYVNFFSNSYADANGRVTLSIGGGISFLKAGLNRNNIPQPKQSDSIDFGVVGGFTRLGIGYDYFLVNKWFLGIMVYGIFYSLNGKITEKPAGFINNEFNFSLRNVFGSSIHFGYQLEKRMIPYFKLGFLCGEFNLKSFSNIVPTSTTLNKRKKGLELGAGLDYLMNKSFLVGVEFNYLVFDKIKFTHPNTASYSLMPAVGQLLVNFKYKL